MIDDNLPLGAADNPAAPFNDVTIPMKVYLVEKNYEDYTVDIDKKYWDSLSNDDDRNKYLYERLVEEGEIQKEDVYIKEIVDYEHI